MNTISIATAFACVIANFRLANAQLNEVIEDCITGNIAQSECSAQFTRQWKIAYPTYDFTTPKNNNDDLRKNYDNIRTRISRKYKAHAESIVVPNAGTVAPAYVTPEVPVVDATVSLSQSTDAYDAAYALVMEALKADALLAFNFITELSAHHNF